jgi:transcriptional regulator with XRE-family HTH domain
MCTEMMRRRKPAAIDKRDPNLHGAACTVSHVDSPASNESLCVRLRRERERRQIALSSISANTKISVSLFEALERGDVSRWPSGIYRRSFVRAYARAIGLDPDAVAREFTEQFPDPAEPPSAADATSTAVATKATEPPVLPTTSHHSRRSAVRLKIPEPGKPFVRGHLLAGMRERLVAVACDGGVVVAIALCVFIVCGKFWLPLGVVMLGYYLGGILVLGNTPGVCLWAAVPAGAEHYNHPSDESRPTPPRTGSERSRPASESTHPAWHLRMPAR